MVERLKAASFSEIESEFIARAHKTVWCNVATVDAQQRPRSRILHPVWEGSTGWITTRRHSPKASHLAANPHLSVAYVADSANPVYADCTAEWVDDLSAKQRIWDLLKNALPPLGFNPAPIYERVDHPNFGLLKLTPWRVEIVTMTLKSIVWRADADESIFDKAAKEC